MLEKGGLNAAIIQGYRFELRLDVDGDYPQSQVSVTLLNRYPAHWIAKLTDLNNATWEGDIWYRHANATGLTIAGEVPNHFKVFWVQKETKEYVSLTFLKNSTSLIDLNFYTADLISSEKPNLN